MVQWTCIVDMLSGKLNFLLHNNIVPIALMILLLGGGSAMAANEDVRGAVISSEKRLASVDNQYITGVNLKNYKPSIQVVDIYEQADAYEVLYEIDTIEVVDGVWQPVTKVETLIVPFSAVGDGDLGLYLAEEFSELAAYQLQFLREVQVVEKNLGQRRKVVVTEYRGLIGRMLDPKAEEFVGYDPVVKPPRPQPSPKVAAVEYVEKLNNQINPETDDVTSPDNDNATSTPEDTQLALADTTDNPSTNTDSDTGSSSGGGSGSSAGSDTTASGSDTASSSTTGSATTTPTSTTTPDTNIDPGVATSSDSDTSGDTNASSTEPSDNQTDTDPVEVDTVAPTITLSGAASLEIVESESYVEPGYSAQDDVDGDLTDSVIVSGTVGAGPGSYAITYSVTDAAGNGATAERTITVTELVVEPGPEPPVEEPTPDPEPAPETSEEVTS